MLSASELPIFGFGSTYKTGKPVASLTHLRCRPIYICKQVTFGEQTQQQFFLSVWLGYS